MKKYIDIVRKINQSIVRFNGYLAETGRIEPLKETEMTNNKYFTNLTVTPWVDQRWPNSEKSGVYFLFGYKRENPNVLGVYVGKASLSSAIGYRLSAHLSHYSDKEHFIMTDSQGSDFVLELISSVTFEDLNMVFMTPALEEFLIEELKTDIHLLNSTGNN